MQMTHDDTTLTPSSGNVFADLGFTEPEANVHKMRSDLMIAIERMIAEKHLTHGSRQGAIDVSLRLIGVAFFAHIRQER